jgi:hypothetical protein
MQPIHSEDQAAPGCTMAVIAFLAVVAMASISAWVLVATLQTH